MEACSKNSCLTARIKSRGFSKQLKRIRSYDNWICMDSRRRHVLPVFFVTRALPESGASGACSSSCTSSSALWETIVECLEHIIPNLYTDNMVIHHAPPPPLDNMVIHHAPPPSSALPLILVYKDVARHVSTLFTPFYSFYKRRDGSQYPLHDLITT